MKATYVPDFSKTLASMEGFESLYAMVKKATALKYGRTYIGSFCVGRLEYEMEIEYDQAVTMMEKRPKLWQKPHQKAQKAVRITISISASCSRHMTRIPSIKIRCSSYRASASLKVKARKKPFSRRSSIGLPIGMPTVSRRTLVKRRIL